MDHVKRKWAAVWFLTETEAAQAIKDETTDLSNFFLEQHDNGLFRYRYCPEGNALTIQKATLYSPVPLSEGIIYILDCIKEQLPYYMVQNSAINFPLELLYPEPVTGEFLAANMQMRVESTTEDGEITCKVVFFRTPSLVVEFKIPHGSYDSKFDTNISLIGFCCGDIITQLRNLLKPPRMGEQAVGASCGAIIHNKEETHIYLLKRSCPPQVGFWTGAGGLIEFGERANQAVVREVKEETGVGCETVDNMGCIDVIVPGEGHWLGAIFAVLPQREPYNAEPDKHSDGQWFPLSDLPPNLTVSAKKAIARFRMHLWQKKMSRSL